MNANNKPCPLPDSHNRLNQAYSIFKELLNDYQDPSQFTNHLNNILQALRNVTFILQGEKKKIHNFDKWYEPYRNQMKNDEIMRWLVASRNHVVKKGDLEKFSRLTLSLKNHFNQCLFTNNMNPFITLQDAASIFLANFKLKIPNNYREETLIEVEREWVVVDFPGAEVIDLLIYCHSVLTSIVFDAHRILQVEPSECSLSLMELFRDDYRVVLRNEVKRHRIVNIQYHSGKIIQFQSEILCLEDEALNKESFETSGLKDRYGDFKRIMSLMNRSGLDLPFNQLDYHIEAAKHIMSIDKFLYTTTFLYFSDKEPEILTFDLCHPSDRYLMVEKIAERVEETHCKALVHVAEAWEGKMWKSGEEPIPPRMQEDKKELILIIAASPEKVRSVEIDIFRDEGGNITFGEEQESSDASIPFLSKVMKVWDQ